MVGTKVEGRTCGTCQACCTNFPVKDAGTKAYEDCQYQCAEGCSIYNEKPKACNDYKCLWLYGYGAESDRPDRCGVLIDNMLRIQNSIQCKPLFPGAADTPEGMRAIRRIARHRRAPALVAGYGETHMVRVVGREPK